MGAEIDPARTAALVTYSTWFTHLRLCVGAALAMGRKTRYARRNFEADGAPTAKTPIEPLLVLLAYSNMA